MYDDEIGQPHDALFRRVLGRPEHAGSELRSILPPGLAARIDLDHLEPVPGTFVDGHLRQHHTDVLFRTTFDQREAYVYVLLEHQRTPDPFMALRMIAYQVQIWNRYLAEARKGGAAPRSLPPIIPLVIYQGRRPWTGPTDLADLLDLDPDQAAELQSLVPHVRYLLDDLTVVDDAALRNRPLTPATRVTFVFLDRAPDDTDVTRWLAAWLDDLRLLSADPEHQPVRELFTYLVGVSNTPPEHVREFAAQLGPEAEEAVMNNGQRYFAQGMAQGVAQGMARGVAEGQAELLLRMLGVRFGQLDDVTRRRVQAATPDQIVTWSDRFVQGNDLEEILA